MISQQKSYLHSVLFAAWAKKNAVLFHFGALGCRVQLLNILGCVCIKMNFTETFINHSCQREASQVIEQH